MRKITLKSNLCIGDHLILEMSLASLHVQFPGEYQTNVDIPQKEIFKNHPLIAKHTKDSEIIEMHYPLINRSSQVAYSFAEGYCQYLGEQLGVPLRLQCNKPHIYLTKAEKEQYKEFKPYWVVVCGSKTDFTAKALPKIHLQRVVDELLPDIKFIQPIKPTDIHYPLNNVKIISKLSIRDLFSLIWNADGVICPVTAHHHMAGAFDKPCICISGSRESPTWVQAYTKQTILNTIGFADCCQEKACWTSRVIALGDGKKQDSSLCKYPIFAEGQWCPLCLLKIKPETIINLIRMYM